MEFFNLLIYFYTVSDFLVDYILEQSSSSKTEQKTKRRFPIHSFPYTQTSSPLPTSPSSRWCNVVLWISIPPVHCLSIEKSSWLLSINLYPAKPCYNPSGSLIFQNVFNFLHRCSCHLWTEFHFFLINPRLVIFHVVSYFKISLFLGHEDFLYFVLLFRMEAFFCFIIHLGLWSYLIKPDIGKVR